MKVCPVCKESMHTVLDEINHEERHTRHGVKSEKQGGPGKGRPEIARPGAHGGVIRYVTNNITPIKRKTVKHCPTCSCTKMYDSNAERQRAYRQRKARGAT